MKPQPNASSLLSYQSKGMLGIVLLLIFGVFGNFIYLNKLSFNNQVRALAQDEYRQQQQQISAELAAATSYISYMHDSASKELKQQAKAKVEHAYSIANSLYQQQKDQLSKAQLQKLIVETLRPLRFFNGRGYYFIASLQGDSVLSANNPEMENSHLFSAKATIQKSAREVINSVKNPQQAGFSSYRWPSAGNPDIYANKISYAKVFTPYDWIIGSGDYVDRFTADLHAAALLRLSQLRIDGNGYIAVLDKDANWLLAPPAGNWFWQTEMTDPNNSGSLDNLLAFAAAGGGFISTDLNGRATATGSGSLSLVKSIDDFQWIIVAGSQQREPSANLVSKRQSLRNKEQQTVGFLVFTLLLTIAITLTFVLLFSRSYKLLFKRYQANIEHKNHSLQEISKELRVAASFFNLANEGIIIPDAQQNILAVNPACTTTNGYSEAELLGGTPNILSSGKHDTHFYQQMWRGINKEGKRQGEIWNKRKSGQVFPQWMSVSVCKDEAGEVLNYISIFSDSTERKNAEQRLRRLAEYDPLTELANRRLLSQRAEQAISFCHRNPGHKLALMFIDLDRFKNINDSLGHAVGDKVLQQTAKRLLNTFRSSDTVCRLGGDEFIILIDHIEVETAAAHLADRVLHELAQPLQIEELDLVITPSIGIAVYPDNGKDFGTLLKNADAALYHAKSEGRNNFQFFTNDMNIRATQKLSIERDLRKALKRNEFEIHYQAQYDLSSGQLSGCEALIRWRCPTRGLVPPDQFISIAEEAGIIIPIGNWVIAECCRQAVKWQQQGLQPLSIAVNVSSGQFNKELVPYIRNILLDTGLESSWLVVEVTESALMNDPQFSRQILLELQALGIEIALDDFGTGYSSLAYLKRFPIDKLKIDKVFIDGLPKDKDDIALTKSVIDVAANLNMTTIAEGVETQAQYLFLQQLGCQQMQGYYKAKPQPAAQFAQLIGPVQLPSKQSL
ncbi:MAG: hypothetical protein OFPI_44310 [Osedax symbiont Rs2]|nr:MAG: hypothetical protein OFPI_44310 [Osedax symbiont Rs2]